jgi:hypothetical protein
VRGDRVGLQGEGLLDGFGEGDRENGFEIHSGATRLKVLHRSCALRRNVSLDALRREFTGRRASQRHCGSCVSAGSDVGDGECAGVSAGGGVTG